MYFFSFLCMHVFIMSCTSCVFNKQLTSLSDPKTLYIKYICICNGPTQNTRSATARRRRAYDRRAACAQRAVNNDRSPSRWVVSRCHGCAAHQPTSIINNAPCRPRVQVTVTTRIQLQFDRRSTPTRLQFDRLRYRRIYKLK